MPGRPLLRAKWYCRRTKLASTAVSFEKAFAQLWIATTKAQWSQTMNSGSMLRSKPPGHEWWHHLQRCYSRSVRWRQRRAQALCLKLTWAVQALNTPQCRTRASWISWRPQANSTKTTKRTTAVHLANPRQQRFHSSGIADEAKDCIESCTQYGMMDGPLVTLRASFSRRGNPFHANPNHFQLVQNVGGRTIKNSRKNKSAHSTKWKERTWSQRP